MEAASFQELISSGTQLTAAAVDPGLNTAGFCIVSFTDAKPHYISVGSVSSIIIGSEHKANSVGLAIQKARQVSIDISKKILVSGAKIVVIETPPQHFAGNTQTKLKKSQDARLLFGMVTMLYGLLLAADINFNIVTAEPSQWQPGFARGNTKDWSIGFAGRVCPLSTPDEHAADAVSMMHIISGSYSKREEVRGDVI